MTIAFFRFYAELNVFLKPPYRQRMFDYPCSLDASVKHMIEALGVPHTEVDLILVNQQAVDFSYRLQHQDRISVYPWFANPGWRTGLPGSLQPSGNALFIADAHLGKLARDLRMLGFDVLYRNDFADADVVHIATQENRIVLTRDRDLLIRKAIERGCYLYATSPSAQLHQVIARYQLADRITPLSRCLNCNGLLCAVDRQAVLHRLPARSSACSRHFFICAGCEQVYWDGSHTARMRKRVAEMLLQHCAASPVQDSLPAIVRPA